ncbi:MAG: butyrate kinase [Verrucomicrobia bacterium]|nr:butyrate kinase [Verrucomicrobiota bacterium]
MPLILVVNPGSTSTKVAVFRGRRPVFESVLDHDPRSLGRCGGIIDQAAYRKRALLRELKKHNMDISGMDLFAARGGLLRPLSSGVYRVNSGMLDDLRGCRYGEHASNLGAIMAWDLAAGRTRNVFIADPVVVDELSPEARLSGLPDLPRRSIFHALNQKAVARLVALKLGRRYESCRLIVAHVGGGISIGVHKGGRVVDVNNALEAEGPFTCERSGGVPAIALLQKLCDERVNSCEAKRLLLRRGGLLAHLGTNDCRTIEQRVRSGDRRSRLVFGAFVYQMAKAIGAAAAALSGRVDAVALTGNVMQCRWVRNRLSRMVRFVAPVHVVAGSIEMKALANSALDVHEGLRKAARY